VNPPTRLRCIEVGCKLYPPINAYQHCCRRVFADG
jgi:hypothetical protein